MYDTLKLVGEKLESKLERKVLNNELMSSKLGEITGFVIYICFPVLPWSTSTD